MGLGAAGCLGNGPTGIANRGTTAAASIFVLYDFARNVAGDAAETVNLVPLGAQGHGWEPSAQVQLQASRSDVYLHLGEGAQAWAEDVAHNLRTDNPDVVVVDASEDMDLLPADDGEEDQNHVDDDGHDHRDHDPHFWMDPVRAKAGVNNVAAGLAEADPDNSTTYESNAATYNQRLDALHDIFQAGLSGAARDTVVLAGHDILRYTADRYGFDVFSPVGVSPDASPSPRAIQRVQETLQEQGLSYILSDALESTRTAEQLATETGTEVLPVTAVAGQTEEWQAKDWGYLEQMERVNLASLRTALEA